MYVSMRVCVCCGESRVHEKSSRASKKKKTNLPTRPTAGGFFSNETFARRFFLRTQKILNCSNTFGLAVLLQTL